MSARPAARSSAAAWRSGALALRRALLGGASRRSAGGAAGGGQRKSGHRATARLPVRRCRAPRQGADRGPAQRHERASSLALALIGADGIWSAVRHHLFPEVQPRFSGLIAWRGTLDATQLPREYTAPGSSSGWARMRIWSPIRSRAAARSTWSRWCRAPGTGRAGARPAMPARSRTRLHRRAGRRGAHDDRRGRQLAEMGAVRTCPTAANGPKARSRCWATPRTRCCRLRRRARHGDRGRRGARQI